jgi:DNA polymerase III epsilon subunit-like protein
MNAKYIIIDTETTGLFFEKHGLIQVAAIVLDKELNELDTYCQDICPPDGFEVSEEAMTLTGFTLERIAKGKSYEEFCQEFLKFLKRCFPTTKPIAIGQFYCFDWAFLNKVFASQNLLVELNEILSNDFLDTKALVNSLNLKAEFNGQKIPFPITSLSKPGGLKDTLGISQDKFVAHDALGDCQATKAVLVELIKRI